MEELHVFSGFYTFAPLSKEAADLLLSPHGLWNRPLFGIVYYFRVLYLDLQSKTFFAEIPPLLSRALQFSLIQSRQISKADRPTNSDRNKQVIFKWRTELVKKVKVT
jgi:hypothetical protein